MSKNGESFCTKIPREYENFPKDKGS